MEMIGWANLVSRKSNWITGGLTQSRSQEFGIGGALKFAGGA